MRIVIVEKKAIEQQTSTKNNITKRTIVFNGRKIGKSRSLVVLNMFHGVNSLTT